MTEKKCSFAYKLKYIKLIDAVVTKIKIVTQTAICTVNKNNKPYRRY